jgi:hypothetical protein
LHADPEERRTVDTDILARKAEDAPLEISGAVNTGNNGRGAIGSVSP